MNKLTARRSFRHGGRTVNPGDTFVATPTDTQYYLQYGWAEADGEVEAPKPKDSRRAYERRDMQAAPDLVESARPAPSVGRRRGRPPVQATPVARSEPPQPPVEQEAPQPASDSVVETPRSDDPQP